MLGVNPYIAFKGNCREAIDFYKKALGAEELFSQSYGDSPMKEMGPADAVMHATIKVGNSHIMMCDDMRPEQRPVRAVDELDDAAPVRLGHGPVYPGQWQAVRPCVAAEAGTGLTLGQADARDFRIGEDRPGSVRQRRPRSAG